MKGYVINIEQAALADEDFRRVLYTAPHSQLVVMSLKPGEAIGEEVHQLDQFIRCERGSGEAVLSGNTHPFTDGLAVVIPAGVKHNIINTSQEQPLKLYTLYSPPNHRDGVVHTTKEAAEADHEEFDGRTSE